MKPIDFMDALSDVKEEYVRDMLEGGAEPSEHGIVKGALNMQIPVMVNTNAAGKDYSGTGRPFGGKLRYLAVLASAAACVAGVVGIVHMHRGSDDDSLVAESVFTDVREEESETDPVQTTLTSAAEEHLTVRTTAKALTTEITVTTGKQQGSTVQSTGTTAAAIAANTRTTASRTTTAPTQTMTVRTTSFTQYTTAPYTTVQTTAAAPIEYANDYPGPNYHIILRPVAYFSDDPHVIAHDDAWMDVMNNRGKNEIQFLSEIRVLQGELVDPATNEAFPEGAPAYSIRGAAGGDYFEAGDLNTDIDLFVHNYADEHESADSFVSNSLRFASYARNNLHVWDGQSNMDMRDTEIREFSENWIEFYMFARPSAPDDSSWPLRDYVDTTIRKYSRFPSIDTSSDQIIKAADTVLWLGKPYFPSDTDSSEEPHYFEKTAKATYFETTVMEYNVLEGTVQVLPPLKAGDPIPAHPMPN